MLLALILAAGSAQPLALPRGCRDRSCVRGRSIVAAGSAVVPPAFEFAPVNGAGMGTVCACTTPTGSKGEAMTFDGGSTYCTKHNEFTGIQPGDMVLCAADQPRVMPGGDGSGGLGIQAWDTRINYLVRSQEFENAAWLTDATGTTVTANACLAPDNTMTADLVKFPATSSYIYQHNCAVNFDVRTVYARTILPDAGFDDGGVLSTWQLYPGSGSGGTGGLAQWTINSAGYTRIEQYDLSGADTGAYFLFGNFSGTAQQVCLWQADCQDNTDQSPAPYPPPIKTASAAVSRNQDVPLFLSLLFPMRTNLVLGGKLVTENGHSPTIATLIDANNGSGLTGNRLTRLAAKTQCEIENGNVSTFVQSTTSSASDADTLSCSYDGNSTLTACLNGGGCGTGSINTDVAPTASVTLGAAWNSAAYTRYANGVIKNLSISTAATKAVYLFGDSIVEGLGAGVGHQPQFIIHNALGNRVAIQNEGVSGNTVPQCANVFTAQLNIVKDAGTAARSYFMLQCGINSEYDDGGTSGGAANVVTQLEALWSAAQDAGVHMLGSTVTPAFSSNTFVQAVNTPLLAYGTAHGIPVANTFSALESPPGSGHLNPAYDFGDTVHLNDAGTYVETVLWMQTGGW